jgi:hypothetical protein
MMPTLPSSIDASHKNREGFWNSTEHSNLPHPTSTVFADRKKFLRALNKIENKAKSEVFRGSSTCRMCGQLNGNETFSFVFKSATWVWPSGLSHYIEDHQVRPSLAFEEFITAASAFEVTT